eukprot:403364618
MCRQDVPQTFTPSIDKQIQQQLRNQNQEQFEVYDKRVAEETKEKDRWMDVKIQYGNEYHYAPNKKEEWTVFVKVAHPPKKSAVQQKQTLNKKSQLFQLQEIPTSKLIWKVKFTVNSHDMQTNSVIDVKKIFFKKDSGIQIDEFGSSGVSSTGTKMVSHQMKSNGQDMVDTFVVKLDFETENLISNTKFRLTEWTINQYQTFTEILQSEKNCLEKKCLAQYTKDDINESQNPLSLMDSLHKCVQNCETGTQEILKMQATHAEVARLTYAKNIQRCLSIHGNIGNTEDLNIGEDSSEDQPQAFKDYDPVGLAHCISHNTDKVDRRFFGYYNNQRLRLINKYSF